MGWRPLLLSYPSAWKDSSSQENYFYLDISFPSLPPSFLAPSLSFSPSLLPSSLLPLPFFLSHFSYTVNSQLLVLTQSLVKVSPLICCSRLVSWSHTSSLVGYLGSLISSWHGLWNLGSPPVLTASTPGSTASLALSEVCQCPRFPRATHPGAAVCLLSLLPGSGLPECCKVLR